MYYNNDYVLYSIFGLNSYYFSKQSTIFYLCSYFHQILTFFQKVFFFSSLFRLLFLILLFNLLMLTSYQTQALLSLTTNPIHGYAPYLTFDNGITRVTDTNGLLSITLSDGTKFTPTTNNSSPENPIELPNVGQSFANIGMFVPNNIDSIELNSLIDSPYNYWGDDDGDGQGNNGISAIGRINLSIVDKNGDAVPRSATLDVCYAPYKLTLSSISGSLITRYGYPNTTLFDSGNVIYYITPKVIPSVCFATPNTDEGENRYLGPASMWNPNKGFITQSTNPSSYYLNFPTTGANNLYFDLDIAGSGPLEWGPPIKQSGITVTVTPNSTGTSVKVTLTGPTASEEQWMWDVISEPTNVEKSKMKISKPQLPQIFELIGKDNNGNTIVKYGFELRQWFVNRNQKTDTAPNQNSWCSYTGYRLASVEDLTNAIYYGAVSATTASSGNYYQRRIGAGLFTEWGSMEAYIGEYNAQFYHGLYWTSVVDNGNLLNVGSQEGTIYSHVPYLMHFAVCVTP